MANPKKIVQDLSDSNAKKITKDLSFAMKKLVETKEYKDLMMGIKNIQSTFSAYSQSEEKKFIPVLNKVSQSEEYKKAVQQLNEMDKDFFSKLPNTKEKTAFVRLNNFLHGDNLDLQMENVSYHRINFFVRDSDGFSEIKKPTGQYIEVIIAGSVNEYVRNQIIENINMLQNI